MLKNKKGVSLLEVIQLKITLVRREIKNTRIARKPDVRKLLELNRYLRCLVTTKTALERRQTK